MTSQELIKKVAPPEVLDIAKALSNELRLRILEALSEKPMSIGELTKHLGVAQPTISINVGMLEQVGLITSEQKLGRGKLCLRVCDQLLLELPRSYGEISEKWQVVEMPVGMYTGFRVKAPCGMVGASGLIGMADEPRTFFLPERSDAALLWFSEEGYVEYSFPNLSPSEAVYTSISISAELGSEYSGSREDWPSDITLFINGVEIGTYSSPGDYGREKGSLTPSWWLGGTQYGRLTEWVIGKDGSLLNGHPCSTSTLEDLQLHDQEAITVRFEVKADAIHRGGLNLFGATFGNEPQAIRLTYLR